MVKIVEKTGAAINSTRRFVWAGQEKLEFMDAADAVTMRIFPQGQHNGATQYFFTRDHLGSVREVLSGGGTAGSSMISLDGSIPLPVSARREAAIRCCHLGIRPTGDG